MSKKLVLNLFSMILLIGMSCVTAVGMAADKTVALFPVELLSPKPAPYLTQGFKTMFVSRLSEVGLRVVTGDSFSELLTEDEKAGKVTQQRAGKIARKLHAQYAIFGTLTAIGKGLSLDLSLLDLTKTPPKVTHVSEAVTEDQFIPRLAGIANRFRSIIEGKQAQQRLAAIGQTQRAPETQGPFYQLGTQGVVSQGNEQGFFISTVPGRVGPKPTGKTFVRMELVGMDVDDLDRDGNPEIAMLSKREFRIYSKKGNTLRLLGSIKAPRGEDFIKVSMGDADQNGKPEIYLPRYRLDGVVTTVYEWDGKFRKLFKKNGHLAVVKSPGRKVPYLLYQNSHALHLFTGRIYIMKYGSGHKLIKKITLPKILHMQFYTLTPYDIDKDGSPEIIGLGDGNSLHIWSLSGSELWNENETIGGSNDAIDLQEEHPDPNLPRIEFNSRIVMADINADGQKEVIAVKNIPIIGEFEHFKYYDSGYLLAYKIKGATLQRSWKTAKMPFCIVDIQSYDQTLFLALQRLKLKNYGKGHSRVLWFELPTK